MPFLTKIKVARMAGTSGDWELIGDLVYNGSRDQFLIPKGFRTDFASIPRLLLWVIPKNGKHDAAAIVHDYLYREQPYVESNVQYDLLARISRKEADGIFRRIMIELGVRKPIANALYFGVRIGGFIPWAINRKAIKDGK